MPRYLVDPRKVKVVEMKDGTRYTPSRAGWVSVAARHDDEMYRSGSRTDHHESQVLVTALSLQSSPSKECRTCGWSGWPWTATCGRCGEAY